MYPEQNWEFVTVHTVLISQLTSGRLWVIGLWGVSIIYSSHHNEKNRSLLWHEPSEYLFFTENINYNMQETFKGEQAADQ